MDRVARRGPLARAPGALKGDTSEIVNIFVAVEGGPFGEKTFSKKISQCRKTERGDPLGFSNVHSVAKHQKIEVGKIFISGKKSHSAEKNCKGGPFGIFQHPF